METILDVYEQLGGDTNGALIYSIMLKIALEKRGYHVPFLTGKYSKYPIEATEVYELPSMGIGRHRFVKYWPWSCILSVRRIARQLPNLSAVIANGAYKSSLHAAQIADRVSRETGQYIPKIIVHHTQQRMYMDTWRILGLPIPKWGKNWWMRRYRRTSKLYDVNIALTESIQKNLADDGIESTYIPIGIMPVPEPKETKAELRRELSIPEDHFVYLYTGRIVKEKNIETLLASFAKVQAEKPKSILILVGGGKLEFYQELAEKLGIPKHAISFVGRVDRKEIGRYYKIADAFVTASITENSPIVIIEALQFGLPVIAFGFGGIPEVCGLANDFVVEYHPDDPKISMVIFIGAMRSAQSPELLAQARSKSILRYRIAGYDIEINADRLLEEIERKRAQHSA